MSLHCQLTLGVVLPSTTVERASKPTRSKPNPCRSCRIACRPYLAIVFASKLRRSCERSTRGWQALLRAKSRASNPTEMEMTIVLKWRLELITLALFPVVGGGRKRRIRLGLTVSLDGAMGLWWCEVECAPNRVHPRCVEAHPQAHLSTPVSTPGAPCRTHEPVQPSFENAAPIPVPVPTPMNPGKLVISCHWMENNRHDYNQQEVVKALLDARQAILEVRNLLREIGETAGVPIEPEPQTQLLDVTMNMEGVLLAGVPGAGGFDAIFAITLGNSARARVAHEWSSNGVLPLLVTEDPKGVALENSDPRDREIASGIHSIKLD
eukprot:Gb_31212 [translate_table: standard]